MIPLMNQYRQIKLVMKGLYWSPLYYWNSYKPWYRRVSSESERQAEMAMRNAQRLIAYRVKLLTNTSQN